MKQRPAVGSTKLSQKLRASPTDAEMALWRLLHENFPAARFRRQVPLVNYVVDFASHRVRVVIEVDGGQHGGAADGERDRQLNLQGYRVLRFWNHDVLANPDAVATVIAGELEHSQETFSER